MVAPREHTTAAESPLSCCRAAQPGPESTVYPYQSSSARSVWAFLLPQCVNMLAASPSVWMVRAEHSLPDAQRPLVQGQRLTRPTARGQRPAQMRKVGGYVGVIRPQCSLINPQGALL